MMRSSTSAGSTLLLQPPESSMNLERNDENNCGVGKRSTNSKEKKSTGFWIEKSGDYEILKCLI